ncbi:MAG: M48 family metalloprotease [Candidatus Rokuibacteriota bacterium]
MRIRGRVTALATGLLLSACASAPEGTYYASPTDPDTTRMAHILHRAARAGGDDPQRYGFAFIKSPTAAGYSDEDATFYFTDGLMRQPAPIVEAVVAHEVAHEVLGHVGTRRKLSLSLTATFGALGIFTPGVGLLDFVVNPLVVRAFGRHQEMQADQKAVEILRAMGHRAPRRALATALETLAAHTPKEREGLEGLLATHPTLDDRLAALVPLEPPAKPVHPVARARPRR